MQVAFLLPPGSSAGGAYARRMAAALTGLGHAAILPDAADPTAALAGVPSHCAAIVDGMLLPHLAGHAGLRDATALMHRVGAADAEQELAALRQVPRILASSQAVHDRLVQAGLEAARITLVTPAADDAPRSAGSGGPGCALLAVGAITARKGHATVLRALARLHDLPWTLTVAGASRRDPTHAPTLLALAEALGVTARLTLVPDPDDDALDSLWAKADVFALASRWEGYPTGIAQALRRGLPVATTTEAGALLPLDAGITAPAEDVEQFSKALRRMIFDAELRADMAEAAWQAGQRLPRWADQAQLLAHTIQGNR